MEINSAIRYLFLLIGVVANILSVYTLFLSWEYRFITYLSGLVGGLATGVAIAIRETKEPFSVIRVLAVSEIPSTLIQTVLARYPHFMSILKRGE